MQLTVRDYRPEDEPAVVALSLRAWEPVFASTQEALGETIFARLYPDWRTNQADAVRAALHDEAMRVWVAQAGDAVAGFAAARIEDELGELYMVAVDPAHQRRGAGRLLTDTATEWLRASGATVAMVETGGDPGHAPARALYARTGYSPMPIERYFRAL